MSHSDSKPAEENAKQTEKMKISNLPDIELIPVRSSMPDMDIIPLSSTSIGQNNNEKSIPLISMAHIVPLQRGGINGPVNLIQVSPIRSLPMQNVKNLIKLPSGPFPGLNINNLQNFHVGNRVNVLRPVKNVPITGKIAGPVVQVVKKIHENDRPSSFFTVPLTGTIATVTSSNTGNNSTNQVLKRPLPNKQSIPAILQKRAKLDTPKNATITKKQNKDTEEQISTSTESTKVNPSTSNQETKINCDQPKNQDNTMLIEIQVGPSNEVTSTKKVNEKETKDQRQKKPSVRKDRSPKKKRKESYKEKNQRNQESVYIADGFREDVEDLIEKCLLGNKLNFERFCELWKEMEFPCIYYGRQSGAELAELSEEVIQIAKTYMLARNDNFEENVAGLFLVYALLNHQPFTGFASLRLVPRDVPLILNLEAEARQQKRHDVLFILGSVLIKGPCQFHVLEREVSMELSMRKYFDGTVQTSPVMETVCTRNAPCVSLLKKLIPLDERFEAVQKQLEKYREQDKTVQVSKRPAAQLYELYRAHIPQSRSSDRCSTATDLVNQILSPKKAEESRAGLVKSIKDRAMTNVVDTMKHLTGVDERQDTSSSSEDSEVEIKRKRRTHIPGRSNASAMALQKFFSCKEKHFKLVTELEPQNKKKSLADVETVASDKQTKRGKPFNKRTRKKLQTDDSVREIYIADTYNEKEKETDKQKTPAKNKRLEVHNSNPDVDLVESDDIKPSENRIGNNLNVSPESDNSKHNYNENFDNTADNQQKSNYDMPLISIEIERVCEDEMDTNNVFKDAVDESEKEKTCNVPKSKASKDVSNNNNVSKRVEHSKDKKVPKIEKSNLKQTSDSNTNKKGVSTKSKAKKESSNSTNTITNSKKDDKGKKIKKQTNTKADLKPSPDSKNKKDTPKTPPKKKGSSNPLLDPDKSKNTPSPEILKSRTRKTKSAIDNSASPKMKSSSEESTPIVPKTRESPRNKNRGQNRTDKAMEQLRPSRRKRMQNEG